MDENIARKILNEYVDLEDDTLHHLSPWVLWNTDSKEIELDGEYSADELEAMVWWMRNKKK